MSSQIGPQSITQYHNPNPQLNGNKHIPFDQLHLNIEDPILYRSLNSMTRWCIIACVPSDHKQYDNMKNYIEECASNVDKGQNATFDTTNDYKSNSTISKHKWYSIDLRKKPDLKLTNKLSLNLPTNYPDWYYSLYLDKCYNKCKGLVIYIDNINDIPLNIYARSTLGFCTFTETELNKFIFLGSSKLFNDITPLNTDNSIVGYINAHKWTKCIKFN
jgi:hypothetical protein